ncbi:MAG: DUF4872 domain-containing protein [Chloroflexi bacterium]|nr:DUF4872 domain-containing protein [Chloroflexota bacterium]
MPILKNYRHFAGRHRETGSLHNILAYQGQPAPHTGQPISEALLLGISGGITVGYFTFEYEGYLPHIALLTRNTFDPLETMFERLALPREVLQTSKPETGVKHLLDTLDSGHPALVWADAFLLPYNLLPHDDRMWMMTPIVVYGADDDTTYVADRSGQPLTVPMETLTQARARVKADRFRILVLDTPDMNKLPAAVQKGIWQCLSLYTDAPPKGRRENFGLAALEYWATMLTNTRNKHSWERYFPVGSRLYAALAGDTVQPGAFDWISTWGTDAGADRNVYANFLDEAAAILNKPDLKSAAAQFRTAANAWCALAAALLPDDVPLLKETRDLKLQKHRLFVEQGGEALDDIRAINRRLDELKRSAGDNFPLSEAEVREWCETLAQHVLTIRDLERSAVGMMQAAMS